MPERRPGILTLCSYWHAPLLQVPPIFLYASSTPVTAGEKGVSLPQGVPRDRGFAVSAPCA